MEYVLAIRHVRLVIPHLHEARVRLRLEHVSRVDALIEQVGAGPRPALVVRVGDRIPRPVLVREALQNTPLLRFPTVWYAAVYTMRLDTFGQKDLPKSGAI